MLILNKHCILKQLMYYLFKGRSLEALHFLFIEYEVGIYRNSGILKVHANDSHLHLLFA